MKMDSLSGGASFEAVCLAAQARAEETETNRQLAADLAHQLADAGLFSMYVPRAIGGQELTPLEANARLQKLAMYDAASAWVAMIGSTASIGAAYIEPDIARDMFVGKGRITCGIFAPNGRALCHGDEYIVSGRWAWASGSANADYIGLGCMALDSEDDTPAGDKIRLLMVPRASVIFHDTWHTMGLCGSSSGDVEVDNIRVPMAHSYSIATQSPWDEGALYKMPYFGLLATGVGAVALGNARTALDNVIALATEKTAMGHRRPLSERGAVQTAMAQAQALWASADAYYWQTLQDIWAALDEKGAQAPLAPEQRAQLRLISTHAVRTSVEVVRMMHDVAGGTSVYKTSPVQRCLRDSETMTQHMIANGATYEMIGRVMLGGYHGGMQL